jgi:hypothetical protein
MATIATFRAMSGIKQTSSLEITSQRAQDITQAVSSKHPVKSNAPDASPTAVNVLPVSSYVTQAKPSVPGSASIVPNMPPFAAHWGIVIGIPRKEHKAFLFHLVLDEDEEGIRSVQFAGHLVGPGSKSIKRGEVKQVGETRFGLDELVRIGEEMIRAFGNYHLVFWNCQMFAKCYLRVITGSDASFDHWTTADVTNLFLCAFVISTPIASTSKLKEHRRRREFHGVGTEVANGRATTHGNGQGDTTERQVGDTEKIVDSEDYLFRASDEVIDLMKEAVRDEEMYKKLSEPLKDSPDKRGLIQRIKSLWQKVTRQ